MRSLKDMLARTFLGGGWSGWPGPQERTAGGPFRLPQAERTRQGDRAGGRSGAPGDGAAEEASPGGDGAAEEASPGGDRAAERALPPLKPDWRDIVAFTIAMYQILAVPFALFCGVALFIYFLLWLWAR